MTGVELKWQLGEIRQDQIVGVQEIGALTTKGNPTQHILRLMLAEDSPLVKGRVPVEIFAVTPETTGLFDSVADSIALVGLDKQSNGRSQAEVAIITPPGEEVTHDIASVVLLTTRLALYGHYTRGHLAPEATDIPTALMTGREGVAYTGHASPDLQVTPLAA